MRGGDLSNQLPPRWLFVFEGVIGDLRPDAVAPFKLAMRMKRWRRAADCFELIPHVQKIIWDLTWRRDYRFDIVTFLGQPFCDALERRLARESLPFSNLWSVDEASLSKRLATMPDVLYVIHSDPSRHLAYGNRGLLVTDPNHLRLF